MTASAPFTVLRHLRSCLLVLLALLLPGWAPSGLEGQARTSDPAAAPETPRMAAGGALALAQPRGEFNDYVGLGFGLHGSFRWNLVQDGVLAIRVQGAVLNYGNETRRVCLSETVGCRIQVDLTTSNNILLLGVGPEVGIPVGGGRLYGNAGVGLGYFSTDSRIQGLQDHESQFQTRNYSDGGFAWNAGAGIEYPLGRVQRYPVAIDFGLSHQENGRRDYLTEGGIIDGPDGSIQFDARRSQANFLLWRLGVSVGIPHGG